MLPSLIQLIKICFVGIKVWPHDPDRPTAQDATSFDFNGVEIQEGSETHILNNDEDQSFYRVILRVSIANRVGKIAPYDVDVCVYGDFHINKNVPIEEREDLITVNGCSMLYGAIREQVMTLSARSIHGMLILPTVHFRDKIKKREEPPSRKQPKTRKPKASG
ncbi:MAG TPA: hypothetical protein DEO56_05845 [Nitrosomonas nitrosa]|nr:hypothetical protein [Nitrosomonas nitrosa]HNP52557.1 protein-export chaperone SecB [Nitrosomonas nitrosa]